MLLNPLWLEVSGTVAGRLKIERASGTFDRLLRLAVFAVGDDILSQMGIQLRFQGRLGEFLDQWGQNTVLPMIALPDCRAFRALSKSKSSLMGQSSHIEISGLIQNF